MEPLREQLLMTLSFLEPMSIEMIFIDLDKEFTLDNPDITMDVVLKELRALQVEKKLRQFKKDGQIFWIKPNKSKKNLWRRILNFISG
jgi:hypothetical protein